MVVCRLNLHGYLYGYLYGCRSRHPYTQSAYIDSSVHCFYRAANYGKTLRGTTCVTPSSGGGGTSNDMPWRDRDEDFLHFAHRVMLYAHAQYYPVNRHKRTQNSSYSFSYVYRIMGGNISSGLCHSLLLLGILFLPNWQSIKSSKFYNHSYN